MKTCPKCGLTTDNFAKNRAKKDGLQAYCRDCVRGINAEYYARTPEKNPARLAAKDRMRDEARAYVMAHFLSHPCVDCGETDPVVLEFDHVRGVKSANIGALLQHRAAVNRLAAEIDKCDVRCANCHRRVTSQRGNWWKSVEPNME